MWWALATRPAIHHRGSVIPSHDLRANMCGPPYDDDDFFLDSAVAQARTLMKAVELTDRTRIVDVGCGLGRLAIGLARERPEVRYLGLDSQEQFIWWCSRYVQRAHPGFRFRHLDVENERYNPAGRKIAGDFRLPVADADADVVVLWGVLTNMAPEHMPIYVSEIGRLLRPGGRALLTAFVEKGVPAASINPSGYVPYQCVGPLHVVRYEEGYLRSVFATHSLSVRAFSYEMVDVKQSEFQLEKR